jgi:hypothetical protein
MRLYKKTGTLNFSFFIFEYNIFVLLFNYFFMKKIFLLLLISSSFFLTSCIKMDAELTLSDDFIMDGVTTFDYTQLNNSTASFASF